jgi:putative addiction module killer protein
MVDIKKTTAFDAWMKSLKGGNARGRITARIDRLASGNPGDAKLLKESGGVFELRIDYGPGYRVYYGRRGKVVVVLLCGGDQPRD